VKNDGPQDAYEHGEMASIKAKLFVSIDAGDG
jgi:hypothetical protein